jgi:hypothetical protein
MLANTPGGDAYTALELEAMVREAGFASVQTQALDGPQTVVVGTR